jgi:polysaccharide export outer membrane protein
MMFLDRFKHAAAVMILVGAAASGAGVWARQQAKDAPNAPAHELTKKTLAAYVVEPPDMLRIEVQGELLDKPISGGHLVRPDGQISLGYYGELYVAGLTPMEIKEKLVRHLRKHLSDKQLGLVVVDPERPGQLKAVAERDSLCVLVDVTAFNSKCYYVVGDVTTPGRLPITGGDTVLDAITYAGGLQPTASKTNIRLVRPSPPGTSNQQVLSVNYEAIVHKGDPTTNYQLIPGDRLIVTRDPEAVAALEQAGVAKNRPAPGSTGEESKPSEIQAIQRRLDALERRLDRVIEFLGKPVDEPAAPAERKPARS